jgi:hypothetical protein
MSEHEEPLVEDPVYEKQLKTLLKYLHEKVPNKRRKVSGRSVLYFKGALLLRLLRLSLMCSRRR